MSSAAAFYQQHLDRVSRSFAFCIRQLPSPLRDWIGLSYLLCRVVDTIEDAPWSSPEPQLAMFTRFDRALLHAEFRLDGWEAEFPAAITADERILLAVAPRLMLDYHELPPPVHEILRELIHSMSQGMQHFCRGRDGGSLYLRSLAEVNQYCFFVAGVVGEMLAKLVARVEPSFQMSEQTLLRAHHFGLFLQKVNLLKDQVGDEREGRHLIPSRALVEGSSRENAAHALEFILTVPQEQTEFRRFCAWSLFLGLEALNVARRSIGENRILKMPRRSMEEILSRVETCVGDNGGLRQLYAAVCERLGWRVGEDAPLLSQAEVPDWILRLYPGPLAAPNLQQLGVAP